MIYGEVVSKTIVIYTALQGSACGYTLFGVGKTFLIYAANYSYIYSFIHVGSKEKKGLEKKATFWTN